ncbi:MAG: transposase, partial [Gemmataceae bacterium]|nr:transposase [Gemmataceae bacterium]
MNRRWWLLSNTTYGTWLPGADRGFVGHVREHRPDDDLDDARVNHGMPGTPYDKKMPGLWRKAEKLMKGPPIHLGPDHAEQALEQFKETSRHRGWQLAALSIMHNHFHIVVGVEDDPEPGKVLGDFKSWGTRRLSRVFGEPESKTWWTSCGSKRELADLEAVSIAARYTLFKQPNPLVAWSPKLGKNPEHDPTATRASGPAGGGPVRRPPDAG